MGVRNLLELMWSPGKGFGGIPLQSLGDKLRRQLTSSHRVRSASKYMPHIGKAECARRVRQRQRGTHGL